MIINDSLIDSQFIIIFIISISIIIIIQQVQHKMLYVMLMNEHANWLIFNIFVKMLH